MVVFKRRGSGWAAAEGVRSGFCAAGPQRRTSGFPCARYGMTNVMDQAVFLGLYIGHACGLCRPRSGAQHGGRQAGVTLIRLC